MEYFDIRICVCLLSGCCPFIIGLSSGLSVCLRLRFQHCANDRFSVAVMNMVPSMRILFGNYSSQFSLQYMLPNALWYLLVFCFCFFVVVFSVLFLGFFLFLFFFGGGCGGVVAVVIVVIVVWGGGVILCCCASANKVVLKGIDKMEPNLTYIRNSSLNWQIHNLRWNFGLFHIV